MAERHNLSATAPYGSEKSFKSRLLRDLEINKYFYIMLIPVVAYYLIFNYWPMYGATIAFRDYKPVLGIMHSPWVGLEHFIDFFHSRMFLRTVRNTLAISLSMLVFSFPAPIIFAIFLNEVTNIHYKKAIQTITYLPHFISMVIICGLVRQFTSTHGFINQIYVRMTGAQICLIDDPKAFRAIYVLSGIWQELGFSSIMYLAAISGIDPQLYEAAVMDGCGKFRQMRHITLPGIMPTVVVLLILQLGGLMNVGWEKVFMLYSPLTYETADTISTYVYRKAFNDMSYGYSTAVGFLNSVVNFIMIIIANTISRKVSESSLW